MNSSSAKKSQAKRRPLNDAVAAAIASALNPPSKAAKLAIDETTGSAHFFSANNDTKNSRTINRDYVISKEVR
jgi:hypothetical protein